MIDKLKPYWYLLCAKWKYRKQGYNEVCCCGTCMAQHSVYDNHTPRCAKEYAITSYVEGKMK